MRFYAKMKAAGLNMLRAARARRAKAMSRTNNRGFTNHAYGVFKAFKELVKLNTRNHGSISRIQYSSILKPDSRPENFKFAA